MYVVVNGLFVQFTPKKIIQSKGKVVPVHTTKTCVWRYGSTHSLPNR